MNETEIYAVGMATGLVLGFLATVILLLPRRTKKESNTHGKKTETTGR
jgi:hypothetical protein